MASAPTEQERHAAPPGAGAAAPGGGSGEGGASGPGGQGSAIVYLDELIPPQQPGSWYQEGAKAVNGRDFARSVAMRQPSRGQTTTTA